MKAPTLRCERCGARMPRLAADAWLCARKLLALFAGHAIADEYGHLWRIER